jgi:hypothetical protein
MPTTTTDHTVRLVAAGEPGVWTACGDRFTITRYKAGRGATADEREQAAAGALDIVDHHRYGTIGDVGANTARVYDRADAVGLIERALRIEQRTGRKRPAVRSPYRSGPAR